MELLSLTGVSAESKIRLLEALNYKSDGQFIFDAAGNKVLDKYLEEPVKLENMLIMPGSTIILDNNPLSVASYLEEYGDVF